MENSSLARRSVQNSTFRHRPFRRRHLPGVVCIHPYPRCARRFRRAARGAPARFADRPLAPLTLFCLPIGPSRHCGSSSFRRPSPHCGHTGLEMGRLWLSDFVHLPDLARDLRLARRVG